MIRKIFYTCIAMVFGFYLSNANAAMDPIKAELTQDFPSTMYLTGATYTAIYIFTNQLPFTLVKPLTIEKNADPASEVSYDDRCTGKYLQPSESCQVTVNLTPVSAGKKLVQLTEAYGYDRVPVQKLSSTAVALSGDASITGSVTTPLANLTFNTAASWKFTFHNTGPSQATSLNLTVTGSQSYQTNCGLYLNPGDNCTVSGNITPTSTGAYTVTATLSYAQGSAVSESTSATLGTGGLHCTPSIPFAPEILNTNNGGALTVTVTLLCTNQSGAAITITSAATVAEFSGVGSFSSLADSGDNNCNSNHNPLASNASCQLTGTYTTPSAATGTATLSLTNIQYQIGSSTTYTASTSTSTNVVDHINNSRIIHLVNNCNFNVWWGMVGGAVTGANPSSCPSGSTTNNGRCLYNGFAPTSGGYELAAMTGEATTKIIQTDASTISDNVLWKGLISASTRCQSGAGTSNSCANNDCGNNGGTTMCTLGFQQPATEAEFTFLLTGSNNVDTYDITQVNGFSIPMSMSTNQTVGSNPYTSCGDAGSTSPQGTSLSLPAANYSAITPPNNMYYWVTAGTPSSCTSNTACGSGEICGLAFTSLNTFVKSCGNFLGYWAANQICQTDASFTSPFGDGFNCQQFLTSPFPNNTYTLTQLLKCSPPSSTQPLFNSCYLSYTGASATSLQQCCGCTNWAGIATPSENCPTGQTDSQWTDNVLPTIQWMKRANPTGYAYPFDDKASTFQCTASSATEYTITFCPDHQTGLPAGRTDGRG